MKSVLFAIAGAVLALSAHADQTFVYRKSMPRAICAEANCALSEKIAMPGGGAPGANPGGGNPGGETPESDEIVWSWGTKSLEGSWTIQLDGKTWIESGVITDSLMNSTDIAMSVGPKMAILDWDTTIFVNGSSAFYQRTVMQEVHSFELVLRNTAGKTLTIRENY